MSGARHWKKALPIYLRLSLRFSLVAWALPLALTLLATLWVELTQRRFIISRAGLAYAAIFGAFFFLLALTAAVGDDLHRNREAQEATVAWNPALVWRTFLYLSALFFLVAAFFAYHQGAWLSALFIFFFLGCATVAKVCL